METHEPWEMWVAIANVSATLFVGVAAILSARYAYRYAVKKLSEENRAALELEKYKSIIQAHERCWSLVSYTSEAENRNSIITWKKIANEEITYIFNPENCHRFMNELTSIFYEEGHGMYFSNGVKDPLFHNRTVLYSLLIKSEGASHSFELKNKEMVKAVFQRTEELRIAIKEQGKLGFEK